MYTEDDFLQLSGIQHFSFCRRQWALIHVEGIWAENKFTAAGEVEHKRVHDTYADSRGGVITMRGLRVTSKTCGISGTCDAVEFYPVTADGIRLRGKEGEWEVVPVEYKHGRSKANDCDRLQLVAQAMCLEEMFSCKITRGYLFYFETRRRECIDVTDDLRRSVTDMFKEMHSYMQRGYTPRATQTKACKSCSLVNECIPEAFNKRETAGEYIRRHIEEG